MHEHIEDARTDDAGHQSPEGQVKHGSGVEAHPPSLAKGQQHPHNRAHSNKQAVGVDIQAMDPEVQGEEIRFHPFSCAGAGSANQCERRPESSR